MHITNIIKPRRPVPGAVRNPPSPVGVRINMEFPHAGDNLFFPLGYYLSPSPQSSTDILILAAQDLQHPSLMEFPRDPKVFIRYYGCGCLKKQNVSSPCCRPFLPRALFPRILIQKLSGSFISLLLMTQNRSQPIPVGCQSGLAGQDLQARVEIKWRGWLEHRAAAFQAGKFPATLRHWEQG